ncbi:unnamed protein product [Heterobilharzia americana]|nr:unnamed protein product [Heterobilharzia americana]
MQMDRFIDTGNELYLNINSFLPISYKKYLVQRLLSHTRKLCSEKRIEEELTSVEHSQSENGCSRRKSSVVQLTRSMSIYILPSKRRPGCYSDEPQNEYCTEKDLCSCEDDLCVSD